MGARCLRGGIVGGLLVVLCLFTIPTYAQSGSLVLHDLPSGDEAVSGFADRYVSYRPGLAMNGFDCEADGITCDHGMGLKQILMELDEADTSALSYRLVNGLLELANEGMDAPTTRSRVARNSQRAQALGFTALSALVLEQNGASLAGIGIQPAMTYSEAETRLVALLQDLDAIRIQKDLPSEPNTDDAVKWVGTLGNLARFVDLYLSLELAYAHYGLASSDLFECTTKSRILAHLEEQAKLVDDMGNTPVVELDFLEKIGLPATVLGVDYDEVQAGNWSLKVHVTVGYAALAQQTPLGEGCSLFEPEDGEEYTHWTDRAVRSARDQDSPRRKHHWAYQTGEGQRFWAEGPFYFNYALSSVMPFWQTVRAQLLDEFKVDDPFASDWFLEPLRGYADIVTPEGAVPPLEDGNKIPMEAAFLLQWNSSYSSDASLGERFAWIARAQRELPGEDTWLNILSLPISHRITGPTAEVVPMSSRTAPQQMILRRDGGTGSCTLLPEERTTPCHYILLNGEPVEGITPGEGHEQSDQLHLLYYVDDTSFLVDGGYDNAPGLENSSWNAYRYHNVMTAYATDSGTGHGGLEEPMPGLSCSIMAPCEAGMFANHAPVDTWEHTQKGRVDVLSASVELTAEVPGSDREPGVEYERTLLFIDDDLAPYLVDVNAASAEVTGEDQAPTRYVMHYQVNGTQVKTVESTTAIEVADIWGAQGAYGSYPASTGHSLFVQQFALEEEAILGVAKDAVREPFIRGLSRGEGVPINRLEYVYEIDATDNEPHFTTVAFVQPRIDGSSPVCANELVRSVVEPGERVGGVTGIGMYLWQVKEHELDVLVVRSNEAGLDQAIQIPFDVDQLLDDITWIVNEDYVTEGVSVDSGRRVIQLEAGYRTGFVRLRSPKSNAFCVATSIEKTNIPDYNSIQHFPNPAAGSATVTYSLKEESMVQVDVFDVLGRHVERLFDRLQAAGRYRVQWDVSDLPAGRYLFRLQADNVVETTQITVVK